jgi:Lamin Tail Domain
MPRVRLLACLLALASILVPTSAGSGQFGIVVSQVFGGGGNAGAPYNADFVELFNRSSSAVNLSGWSVQYATASGTSWSATPLAGTIQPGGYYLVKLAEGAAGSALPAPDATGTTNLSSSSGKIALVRDAAALACGASAGSCSANALVEDLVGFGTAADYEGSGPAPTLSSTTAALRGSGGCADTDVNSADFAEGAPSPRNSASAAQPCGGPPPPTGPSDSEDAAVDVEVAAALSISLERSSISFGRTTSGGTPAPVSERVTVLSNHPAGYALTVQRSAFAPADLPLALQAPSAPAGGTLAAPFAGGGFVPVPITPSSATVGTTSAISATAGDVWPTNVGFASPLPSVAPGRYTATLTFTVIGR